jgi:hypothetical protein
MTMTQQHGQVATTSSSVLGMLDKTQASGTRFSHTERVLHTACEFWVAAAAHSLTRYVGKVPKLVLRDAEAAFAAIGIESVANLLRDARNSLSATAPSIPATRVLAQLQQRLDHLEEPVDGLIGKFAAEQTWSRLERPTFEAGAFSGNARAESSKASTSL